MQGANRSGEGGVEPAICDPGSQLRLLVGGREKKKGRIKNTGWIKNRNKAIIFSSHQLLLLVPAYALNTKYN